MTDAVKIVSLYRKDSGYFIGQTVTADADTIALNIPEGHDAIDGAHDHLSRKVDTATGEVVDYKPDAPTDQHEWNDTIKRWQLSAAAQAKELKHRIALRRIAQIEAMQPRTVREFVLGHADALLRLQAYDDEIVSLRKDIIT